MSQQTFSHLWANRYFFFLDFWRRRKLIEFFDIFCEYLSSSLIDISKSGRGCCENIYDYKSKPPEEKLRCVEISRVSRNHQIDYLNWSPQCLEDHASKESDSISGRTSEMEKGWKAAYLLCRSRNNLFPKKSPLVKITLKRITWGKINIFWISGAFFFVFFSFFSVRKNTNRIVWKRIEF